MRRILCIMLLGLFLVGCCACHGSSKQTKKETASAHVAQDSGLCPASEITDFRKT